MKFLRKTALAIIAVYLSVWLGLAAYFSFADGHTGLLESSFSQIFKRPVSIGRVSTAWRGLSPVLLVEDFKVAGDLPGSPALAFKSLAAELSGLSLLRLWPQFTEFAIQQPSLEIVSLSANQLQIAGIPLQSGKGRGIKPKWLLSWLLNHQNLAWHDGEVIWRRLDGETQRYPDISFVYQRTLQNRIIQATTQTSRGALAFRAESNGEVLEADDWDASFELLTSQGQSLLAPNDLTLEVQNGSGRFSLKTMNAVRVRDFIRLSGLGSENNWLLQSQLQGTLHDVQFEFSGPLLELKSWSLQANASRISFRSVAPAPAMNNLSGSLQASAEGGTFQFATSESEFDWPRWFSTPFQIQRASGQLNWSINASGIVQLTLQDAEFLDRAFTIKNLNASVDVDTVTRSVSNLGELFKVESIADLSFEGGEIVKPASSGGVLRPLFLDASADFEMSDLPRVVDYLPNDRRMDRLRRWWSNAFKTGRVTNGKISYQGEISKNAIYVGRARIDGRADFSDVEIDYGFERQWPIIRNSRGALTLKNDHVVFDIDEVWLEGDRIQQPKLEITSLYRLDRFLQLSGQLDTSLSKVVEFIFNGPLIKPANRKKSLPVTATAGRVKLEVDVGIPLRKVSRARVEGAARVDGGRVVLPPDVPITALAGDLQFTERSAVSSNISAQFLGYPTSAELLTTRVAQPPVLKLKTSGRFDTAALQSWVGKPLLSWFEGAAAWQGEVVIDGPKTDVTARSDLVGIEVSAPQPLFKLPGDAQQMSVAMQLGGSNIQQTLQLSIDRHLLANLQGNIEQQNNLLDRSLIRLGDFADAETPDLNDGIHFDVRYQDIDMDRWLAALIDLANLPASSSEPADTTFLDNMRSIEINATDPIFLGRNFGPLGLSAISVDGKHWIGSVEGDNCSGTLQAEPRSATPDYRFNLSRLHLADTPDDASEPDAVDSSLVPADYPSFQLNVESLKMGKKRLGRLELAAQPEGQEWLINKFSLVDKGISTNGTGKWVNTSELGTITNFDFETKIDEAGDVLDEMDFAGVLRKGQGFIKGNLNWIGAPHEFEYDRLNGDFDMRIRDGELVQVEPGGGKLLGLLNFNAIARRLTLDFRDLFASGLQFDRMRYAGVFADGEAVMRDAYIFSPAVFVQMEGKLDIVDEMIDMEIHISPELGGNLTLLSALANPAAGAVMFITQRLFKDEMRESSFRSFRALGSWDDFELEEMGAGGRTATEVQQQNSAVSVDNETDPGE